MLSDNARFFRFDAALTRLRNRQWLVFELDQYGDAPFQTLGYNTLPSRLVAGLVQNQRIRKAAGLSEY